MFHKSAGPQGIVVANLNDPGVKEIPLERSADGTPMKKSLVIDLNNSHEAEGIGLGLDNLDVLNYSRNSEIYILIFA